MYFSYDILNSQKNQCIIRFYEFKSASFPGTLSFSLYLYLPVCVCVCFYISYKLYLFLITMFIDFYTQSSVFVLTNPRAENEERFFSRLRKSSRDVATNLDFEDLECPFKWNLMFCLCLWILKYQTCWCGKTSLPVLHASQWGKWPFLVHLLVTLPQQFWSKLTFAFCRE